MASKKKTIGTAVIVKDGAWLKTQLITAGVQAEIADQYRFGNEKAVRGGRDLTYALPPASLQAKTLQGIADKIGQGVRVEKVSQGGGKGKRFGLVVTPTSPLASTATAAAPAQ